MQSKHLVTLGMLLCSVALIIGGLDHWEDALKPPFVAGAMLAIGTVLKAMYQDKPEGGGPSMGKLGALFAAVVMAATLTTGCAFNAKPGTPGDAQRLEQIKKAGEVVLRVGTVIEQVQIVEIQLHRDGVIKDADHVVIQKAFIKAADAVLVAKRALDPKAAIHALITRLDELTRAVGNLSAAQGQRLSVLIAAARTLVEAATPLLS